MTYGQFYWKAAQFILSNATSIGIIIFEISSLEVCFDGDEDGFGDGDDYDDDDEGTAAFTRDLFVFALACNLVVEIFPLLSLSIIYRSLLDSKSAHKVPLNDGHCLGAFVARIFVPVGTCFIGVIMGVVALQYSFKKSCDGNGGAASSSLLLVAGLVSIGFATYVGALCCILSPFAWCRVRDHADQSRCCGKCCKGVRGCVHVGLKYLWVADTAWQLLSVAISYRAGTFSVGIAWVVALLTASAEWRATAVSLFVVAYGACSLSLAI